MTWLRIDLTLDEQRLVLEEKDSHPDPFVRRRLWSLWLLHCGTKREQTAKILTIDLSTVQRDVATYQAGGLDALRDSAVKYTPTSELVAHKDKIRQSLEQQPVRTIAEACQRILELTGIERKPTQVAKFLKGMGLKWQRVRAIPVPPKKTSPNMPPSKLRSSKKN